MQYRRKRKPTPGWIPAETLKEWGKQKPQGETLRQWAVRVQRDMYTLERGDVCRHGVLRFTCSACKGGKDGQRLLPNV